MPRKPHSLEPRTSALLQQRFGINLDTVHSATPADLARYADEARHADELRKMLPVLRRHMSKMIKGQLRLEEFTAEVSADGLAAAKKQNRLKVKNLKDAQDYALSVERANLEAQRSSNLLHAAHNSKIRLGNLNLASSLQILALQEAHQRKKIDAKLPEARQRLDLQDRLTEAAHQRMDAVKYGSLAPQRQGGVLQRLLGWLTGG